MNCCRSAFSPGGRNIALRFFGRFQDGDERRASTAPRTSVLLVSRRRCRASPSIGILLLVIAPDAKAGILIAHRRLCDHPLAQSLYRRTGPGLATRSASIRSSRSSDPSVGFVVGLVLIKLLGHRAEWPLAGYAVAQLVAVLIVLPKIGSRPQLLADRSRDRRTRLALRHSADHRRRARLGRAQCVALHRQRDGGRGRGRPVRRRLRSRPTRGGGRRDAGDGGRLPARRQNAWNKAAARPRCASSPTTARC